MRYYKKPSAHSRSTSRHPARSEAQKNDRDALTYSERVGARGSANDSVMQMKRYVHYDRVSSSDRLSSTPLISSLFSPLFLLRTFMILSFLLSCLTSTGARRTRQPPPSFEALDYRPSVRRTSLLSPLWIAGTYSPILFITSMVNERPMSDRFIAWPRLFGSRVVRGVANYDGKWACIDTALHARLIRHCISRRGASWASLTRFRNFWLKLASDPLALNNSEAHCSGCSTM